MELTPDAVVYWQHGPFILNATIVYTWFVMLLLTVGSWLVTRRLSTGPTPSRWQNLLEVLVGGIRGQIREIARDNPDPYLPFVGTLFLFILVPNLLSVVPGFHPPTGSLSTTTALAVCVLVAVPLYGVANQGIGRYLRNYIEPTFFMLPFNIIGELSRTIALAVRLYGNVMSGTMIVGILLSLTPLFFPVVMNLLGLVTGVIQAYIFAILAMVYIAAAVRAREPRTDTNRTDDTAPAPTAGAREKGAT